MYDRTPRRSRQSSRRPHLSGDPGHSRMHICLTCNALFGECGQPTPQRCRCKHGDPQDPWPRGDFNLAYELCRCCGTEPLRSGSRFSIWFCSTCKHRVGELNGSYGRCVVPIGRHSVHAGYLLRGEAARDPVEVFSFLESWRSISEAMDVVLDWAGETVRRNVLELELATEGDSVSLDAYLKRLRSQPLEKAERFQDMVEYLREAGEAHAPERADDLAEDR